MAATEPAPLKEISLKRAIPYWRDERILRVAAQVISAALVIGVTAWVLSNLMQAAEQRGLGLGFAFLDEPAGFAISESVLPYDPSRSFAYALWIGILNTLRLSLVGILFATLLGFLIGVAQLSSNWLVSRLALVFIEAHRNIPLLVLLFLWYRGVFTRLPPVRESIVWPGPVFINQRGFYLAWPYLNEGGWLFPAGVVLGAVAAALLWRFLRRRQEDRGKPTYYLPISLAAFVCLTLLSWLLSAPASGGEPFRIELPVLEGFNFRGGMHLTPEFAALLIGLSTYTAAFIAEIVRAGIQAVNRGQLEAARALGLRQGQTLSLVVIPQAMRVIIPPLISQYLNLTKNSSLAVFLGYPELFSIGKTVINQAGRAVPVFVFIMAAYLLISLVMSLALNLYNRRVQFVER
jgi:general L-amino acid transport system permease protein